MGLIKSVADRLSGYTNPSIWALDWEADQLDPGQGRIILFTDDRVDEPHIMANDFIEHIPPGTLMEELERESHTKIGGQRVPIRQFKLIPPDEEPSGPVEECEDVPDFLVGNPPFIGADPEGWDAKLKEIL